ncbi:ribosome-associated translation inhibitor RaiA [Shewanella sp. A3A]|nr:ribosome-associated translation inhibitor RaiA [Shewanella ferrihydritica]
MPAYTGFYALASVDSLRDYSCALLAKLERYFEQINNVVIVLLVEKSLFTAKAQRRSICGQVMAKIQHDDMYAAIDSQAIMLESQVLKLKKLTNINDGT